MIRSKSNLLIDQHGRELTEDGNQPFRLFAYDADIHQYLAGIIPTHWHRELEVFVLLTGAVEIAAAGRSVRLHAGEGCFLNAEVIHTFTCLVPELCLYRSFVFDAAIVSGMPGSVFDTKYIRPLTEHGPALVCVSPAEDAPYFEGFSRAFSACESENPGYEFSMRAALSDILLYLIQKTGIDPSRRPIPSLSEQRLKQMLAWIDANLSRPVTVGQIAASANICTRECQRIFRRYLRASPTEYLLRRKIFAAAELLAATGRSMTEIALDCGFDSPSYFSKQFRRIVGSTPTEYRRAVSRAVP